MLKFYYNPLSPIARRVWLAILEKNIPFQSIIVNLKEGEQFNDDFITLNPFHRVPIIVEDNFTLFESLAILEYLEEKYPVPSLLSTSIEERATTKMIQLVVTNDLMPQFPKIVNQENVPLSKKTTAHLTKILSFLNENIGNDTGSVRNTSPYFGGESVNLADILVGATLPMFCRLGLEVSDYPALKNWYVHFSNRDSFLQTNPSDPAFEAWKHWLQRWIRIQLKQQEKARRQQATA